MIIEPLTLSHQSLLEPKLKRLNVHLSEYSFASLYLFREIHHYEVMKIDGELFIRGVTRDGPSFIMPTSEMNTIDPKTIQETLLYADILYPIPERWLETFDKNKFQWEFREEDSDYLFQASKFITYSGRHLDSKRNQIHQLLDHHIEVREEPFSDQLEDALSIVDQWQHDYDPEIKADELSCREALLLFKQLNLRGQIVYVDQKPAGFILGEWSCPNHCIAHVSKGIKSIKGIYPFLFQVLAKSLNDDSSWVNIEQDLGIPALRYAKSSYHPDMKMKKYRVYLIHDR